MGASELTTSLGSISMDDAQGSHSHEQLAPLRNRAAEATSPFVRSFADSPVAWQPLDNATVERAKKEHKLIFLHIGYKSCHHCRLMTMESFFNTECAAILSDSFIPIIIDRDERPDLDIIYMNYVQAVSNAGGWPLNLFLTPNLEPVFGGTYWPGPATARRTTGDGEDEVLDFLTIVKKVRKIWREQEARCCKEATEVVGQLREFAVEGTLGTRSITSAQSISAQSTLSSATMSHITRTSGNASSELDLDQLEEAYTHIAGTYDPVYAGFGLAPKFLTPPKLSFLLNLGKFPTEVHDVVGVDECNNAQKMAFDTLRQISSSSLRDHVGGTGFARCSVTPDWSIPNFEKMFVDNALLLSLYLEAWLQSGGKEDSEFFNIVLELANYLSSPPIALPEGGFATSEAADSYYKRGDKDMREGAYYLWTKRDFDAAVGEQASQIVAAYFGVVEDGNVDESHDPNDDFINMNILQVRRTPEDLSRQFNIPVDTINKYITSAKAALREKRHKERIRPELDDKIVTGWNGLVISSLAKTGEALKKIKPDDSRHYIVTATKAVDFIKEKLWDAETKTLYRIWNDRRATDGFADDYAYLIMGVLDLFQANGEKSLLDFAEDLQKTQMSLFYDPAGAFYSTSTNSQHTILRLKDGMDTSLPSTNAVSVANLFRLSTRNNDDKYLHLAKETVNAFEAEVLQHPWLFPGLMSGVVNVRLGIGR